MTKCFSRRGTSVSFPWIRASRLGTNRLRTQQQVAGKETEEMRLDASSVWDAILRQENPLFALIFDPLNALHFPLFSFARLEYRYSFVQVLLSSQRAPSEQLRAECDHLVYRDF